MVSEFTYKVISHGLPPKIKVTHVKSGLSECFYESENIGTASRDHNSAMSRLLDRVKEASDK